MRSVRVLLVADSHLGFDLPVRPRVRRRRRGHDFQANYERALQPALNGRADIVVHGGDVFHRSHVPATVVYQAFEPLVRVAERGVPVFVVPGNHERSHIPHVRFATHPQIHVFDRPRTVLVDRDGIRLALSGFPFERRDIRSRFRMVLEATGWRKQSADIRLLCMHHCVEGATVGPGDFTFRDTPDVIRGRDIPGGFAAVLSGHIHRRQVLANDLAGRPLAAPVLYPGSVERTSIAEKDEPKGYVTLEVAPGRAGGRLGHWRFHDLPARPMLVREFRLDGHEDSLLPRIGAVVAEAPADAVLRIRVTGRPSLAARRTLSAANLRALAPATMNVELRLDDQDLKPEPPLPSRRQATALELPL